MTAEANTTSTLGAAQEKYQYNYTYIEPLAMVEELPQGEYPSQEWLILNLRETIKLILNFFFKDANCNDNGVGERIKEFFKVVDFQVKQAVKAKTGIEPTESLNYPVSVADIDCFVEALKKLNPSYAYYFILFLFTFASAELQKLSKEGDSDQTSSLEEYENLFVILELPAIANNFQKDDTFAYMRVAGPNPVVIERMTEPYPNFPVTAEHYQAVMGADDYLEFALREGRVYIADYALLAGAINGTFPGYQKYLYAPLAMFAVPKGTGNNRMLKPVAIQCQQEPDSDKNPIVTPAASDPYSWMFAKTAVQIADGNFHEAVSHLARTHLLIEPFVIATHRQLPDKHPLSLLLRPHFEGTLFINNAAQKSLVAQEGGVNKLLASNIDNSRVFAVKGLQTYPFNEQMLRAQLERRGVLDTSKLPVYPYRDDALLIWDAIHKWVSSYLNIYYQSDLDVQGDTKLQAWGADVIGFNGGRVIGFGYEGTGSIITLDYLIDATTLIMFTASAQHAAVNFPQKGIMSYAPAMPLAGYAPASSVKEANEQDFLKLLPPLSQARGQLNLTHLLGSVYYTQLGKYDDNYFENEKVKQLLTEFQEELEKIEEKIKVRNKHAASYLPYAYEDLLPSKIPQSTNV